MRFHTRLKGIVGAVVLLLAPAAPAAQPDGPYILADAASGGWQVLSVEQGADGPHRQSRPLRNQAVTVPAVGRVPAFTVAVRGPEPDAPGAIATAKGAPLFVVADTHGEYEILVAMLRAHRVIDARLGWKFGRGHLVVLGDVFDRGPNHLEILWLLYRLEAEAAKAGGGAHLVLGNHEVMAMRGDLRYLNEKYAQSAQVLGVASYADLFAADSVLGQWLRARPAVLRVNDYLCMHAGVSRALLDSRLGIDEIDDAVRSSLREGPGTGAIETLVMGPLGPLWYRGYFPEQSGFPTATDEDVALALRTFGARRILVGHTIVPVITPLYAGRVIAVQVYPKRDDTGHANFESLLIRNGEPWRATLDGGLRPLEMPARE